MHKEYIIEAGNTDNAQKAVILLHGRGGNARDILTLSSVLHVDGYGLYAPQATNNTWYPYAFLEHPSKNEPWLSSAIELVGKTVNKIEEKRIFPKNIYFVGFSQGACLALEYITRNAQRYGGAAAFTGGLIGDKLYPENYAGEFKNTPVFIGTGDPDPHVPMQRIHESAEILQEMGADVTKRLYPNMEHTISQEEVKLVNELIFSK